MNDFYLYKNYKRLFCAIVKQCAYDYNYKRDKEIRRFLLSDWFDMFELLDGELIYEQIKRNYKRTGSGIIGTVWLTSKKDYK